MYMKEIRRNYFSQTKRKIKHQQHQQNVIRLQRFNKMSEKNNVNFQGKAESVPCIRQVFKWKIHQTVNLKVNNR